MTLGFIALINVALGLLTSFGLCSLLGLPYGPMHSLIPCLLVGLGVDNTFVLVQALDNVNMAEKKKSGRMNGFAEKKCIKLFNLKPIVIRFQDSRST